MLVLYFLVQKLQLARADARIAFAAAALHIISPAGVFLSAPCPESLFSFLSFTGTWLLLHSTCSSDPRNIVQDGFILVAGAILGAATTIRSNGIFNGAMLVYGFIHDLSTLPREIHSFSLWRRLASLGMAGLLLGAGFIIPQVVAFFEICNRSPNGSRPRAWCDSNLPSIYTWVQKHYWYK